mmetsp:Transcript_19561/g.39625  ORF Transcript_19561/g.39625 Transcript_19561/m.39625 type:complete len:111 (-) Transcript_19561:3534-3866(-)
MTDTVVLQYFKRRVKWVSEKGQGSAPMNSSSASLLVPVLVSLPPSCSRGGPLRRWLHSLASVCSLHRPRRQSAHFQARFSSGVNPKDREQDKSSQHALINYNFISIEDRQ